MNWTEEMEDYLRTLSKTSWSRQEMAKMLSKKFKVKVSKDAITGKIIRLKDKEIG